MSITDIRWYLAGPMSNIPQFNVPAFLEAAEELRTKGLTIYLPDNLDNPEVVAQLLLSPDGAHGVSGGPTWGDCLAADVKLIADVVDGVIVLPGWDKSRGARLETYVAKALCGKPVIYADTLEPVPERALVQAWLGVRWSEIASLEFAPWALVH